MQNERCFYNYSDWICRLDWWGSFGTRFVVAFLTTFHRSLVQYKYPRNTLKFISFVLIVIEGIAKYLEFITCCNILVLSSVKCSLINRINNEVCHQFIVLLPLCNFHDLGDSRSKRNGLLSKPRFLQCSSSFCHAICKSTSEGLQTKRTGCRCYCVRIWQKDRRWNLSQS